MGQNKISQFNIHLIQIADLYLKPIFIPGLSSNQPTMLNQLSGVTQLIENAITAHFQDNVLTKVLSHCEYLDQVIR